MSEQQETDNFEVVTNEGAEPEKLDTDKPDENQGYTPEKLEQQEPETSDKPAGDTPDTEQERGSNRFQKRIDRLTKRAAEAERTASEERQKREALEQKLTGGKSDSSDEPDAADFDSYSDYLDALAKYNDNEGKQDKPKDEPKSEQKEQTDPDFDAALEDVQASFADSASKYDDFNEVVTSPDVAITPDMVKALAETDDPAALAYYLGKNKDEATRIAGLKPLAIAREFGRIETKLASEPKKRTTQAPDPITPVSGSDGSETALEDMDFSDYEATMNQKTARKGFW